MILILISVSAPPTFNAGNERNKEHTGTFLTVYLSAFFLRKHYVLNLYITLTLDAKQCEMKVGIFCK